MSDVTSDAAHAAPEEAEVEVPLVLGAAEHDTPAATGEGAADFFGLELGF